MAEVRRQPLRTVGDHPQHEPAQPGSLRDRRRSHQIGQPQKAQATVKRAQRPEVQLLGREAGGVDEHQSLHKTGVADRKLRGDEPAHRVSDDGRRLDSQLAADGGDRRGIGGNRDRIAWHLRRTEPGQVQRDHAMLAGGGRNVRKPVLPAATQPMDEHERRAVAQLDQIDPASAHVHPTLTRRPVDPPPIALRVRFQQ